MSRHRTTRATGTDRPVRVALADVHDVVRTGQRAWIEEDPQRRAAVVGAGATADEALRGPGAAADVVVLDFELAGLESAGAPAGSRMAGLRERGYRVLVFSVHAEPLTVRAILEAGAAFLDKRADRAQFVDAIVALGRGQPFTAPPAAGGALHRVQLSAREREALRNPVRPPHGGRLRRACGVGPRGERFRIRRMGVVDKRRNA